MAKRRDWIGWSARADAEVTASADLHAIHTSEALINAINAGEDLPLSVDADDFDTQAIAALFADWRAEVRRAPLPVLDFDSIVAAVDAGIADRRASERRSGMLRLVRPAVGSAAVLALIFGGASLASFGAEPGDPLWKVKEVVFQDEAVSTMAKVEAGNSLEQAQSLLNGGDLGQAKAALDRAETNLQSIKDSETREHMTDQLSQLSTMVKDQVVAQTPTDLGAGGLPTSDILSAPVTKVPDFDPFTGTYGSPWADPTWTSPLPPLFQNPSQSSGTAVVPGATGTTGLPSPLDSLNSVPTPQALPTVPKLEDPDATSGTIGGSPQSASPTQSTAPAEVPTVEGPTLGGLLRGFFSL